MMMVMMVLMMLAMAKNKGPWFMVTRARTRQEEEEEQEADEGRLDSCNSSDRESQTVLSILVTSSCLVSRKMTTLMKMDVASYV